MRRLAMVLCACLPGCAAVPTQLKDAVAVQKTEIDNVRALYVENVSNLLDAVEAYRYEILDLYEAQYMARYSQAIDEVDGEVTEVEPTGDPDVDFVYLSTLDQIQVFFDEQRAAVRTDIESRREQYARIDANFENIEDVNAALGDYLASLARLKNAQDAAASTLLRRVTGLASLPISLDDLPDPTTIEQLLERNAPQLGESNE